MQLHKLEGAGTDMADVTESHGGSTGYSVERLAKALEAAMTDDEVRAVVRDIPPDFVVPIAGAGWVPVLEVTLEQWQATIEQMQVRVDR